MAAPEVFYFQSDATVVSNTRAVLNGVTYAMANITSVRLKKNTRDQDRFIAAVLIVISALAMCLGLGVMWLMFAAGLLIFGAGCAALAFCILFYRSIRTIYFVVLATSGGERHAQRSHDPQIIQSIVEAIGAAIVQRG